MPSRLLAAAAVVWGIAVLVGVSIAAPLWFGFDVNAGLIINALAAFGSVAAARHAVGVVDWLITVPGDGNTVRAGRKQLTVAGALALGAVRQSLGFGSCLVKV